MTRELPILMSQPMVQAIKAGRKGMTRRVCTKFPEYVNVKERRTMKWDDVEKTPQKLADLAEMARYQVGDVLWVRESIRICGSDTNGEALQQPPVIYQADGPIPAKVLENYPHLRTARFMPKVWARLWLEVTAVKAERLCEISEGDAQDEGVQRLELTSGIIDDVPAPFNRVHPYTSTYKDAFKELWDSINGKTHPWDSNPWVWAYTFKRIER